MSDEIFQWGLIGPGRIAHRFAGALKSLGNASLHAVASRSPQRARAFAEQYQATRVYHSYEELVQDAEIDAVYIATTHNFHFEQAMLCLESGKPVLCEKPLTVNAAQSEELFKKARENNLFIMEGLWSRFLPVYQQVRDWLDEGRIGEPVFLSSSFGFNFPRNEKDRVLNPHLAGGGLLDLGVYNIAISQWVLQQDPVSLSADGILGETGVDELTSVNMNYANGAVSQFTCTTRAFAANDFNIFGTKGSIRIHPGFWGPEKVTLKDHEQEIRMTKPFRENGFEYQIEEVIRCIRDGKHESPVMSHDHTLANMKTMDAIRAQLELRYPFE